MAGVLITRPASTSALLAQRLVQLGYTVFSAPLLDIIPTPSVMPDLARFDGVLLTSANAMPGLAAIELPPALFTKPCYCVGEKTAEAARAFGFTCLKRADQPGSGVDLAAMIVGTTGGRSMALLHITGHHSDTGMATRLRAAGHSVTIWPVYDARSLETLPANIAIALQAHDINAVLFFSSRTAATFATLAAAHGLRTCCASLTAIGLSQAVATAASTLPWHSLLIAATPTESAMLDSLHTALPVATS